MREVPRAVGPRRLCDVVLIVVALLCTAASSASAAPEWSLSVENHNAYGAQRASCPGGKESAPGEPDCGIDPFTDSGTTFGRETGFNEYKITVTNTGSEVAGLASVGQTLSCSTGTWKESPTSFTFQWLRNGEPIAGATQASYTTQPADAGKALQCRVTANNAGGGSAAIASKAATNPPAPIIVAPSPPSPVPSPPNSIAAPTGGASEAGKELECKAGTWTNSPTAFTYVWLRNGVKFAETASTSATTNKYTLTSENIATAAVFQCEVVGSNANGAVAIVSANVKTTKPAPEPTSPPPVVGTGASEPLTGPLVSLTDNLPAGITVAGETEAKEVTGTGWTCAIRSTRTAVTCTRSDALAASASYPAVTVHVHVGPTASNPTLNVAAVGGGGAPTAATTDPTTVSEAVPFGIASFTTSVTEESEQPFTQAAGHPFSANATFTFNAVPDDLGGLRTTGGSPKEIVTELPPGFVGDPQAAPHCTVVAFETGSNETPCPPDTAVGFVLFSYSQGKIVSGVASPFANFARVPLYNLEPAVGSAATFGFIGGKSFARLTLNASVRSDGDYGVSIGSGDTPMPTPLAVSLTFCEAGMTYTEEFGTVTTASCTPSTSFAPGATPLLTNPTRCAGSPPSTTLRANTYQEAAVYASRTAYNGTKLANNEPSAVESFVTGCNLLQFSPEVEYGPSTEGGTFQAGQPAGTTFALKVPQADEVGKSGTPALQSATVTLPEGMTADPSGAGGLEACTNSQFGLGSNAEPADLATCPSASQVGTVKVVTPLLEKPLEGQAFIGEPECGIGGLCTSADAEQGHLFRLFLQVRLPERGVIIKLAGKVSANPTTGRLQATFTEQPQLPFSELMLTLKGGPRAPLANQQTCGTATTTTDLTPWSAPGLGGLSGTEQIEGTPNATPSTSFTVDWDGKGGACPPTLPFSPSFLAQTASSAAGQYSPLSVSFGRPEPATESEERDEQNLSGITLNMPEGLLGKIAGVEQCPEAAANAGTCPSGSAIGTATVGAGAGSHPYYLTGHLYLTGPYKGDPFGLSLAVPAEAGPFRLAGNTGTGLEVVRAGIAVNTRTAALTVTSDPLPQIVDGVPLRLHSVRVDVSRPIFTLNPTSCASNQQIAGSITGQPINQGEAPKSASVSTPFAATGCASLPFHPTVTATTAGVTSKTNGASLKVTVAATPGEANIGRVDLTLPKALPSRLSTLQQACTEAQFASNPAACPEGSNIGTATARTPLLNSALSGPVYLVSHGGAEFPDVEMVLQGENGLEIVLDGQTQIKGGITYSRFESLPDTPITSFETTLPEGPHSIFSAAEDLCTAKSLALGATLTGQNGAQMVQSAPISVTGCPPTTSTVAKPTVAIERTKVSGATVRLTVKITNPGRVSLSGAGIRTAKHNAAAGALTLTTSLTKTERAKLRKRRRLRLKLRVGYVPTTGTASSVSTTATFR